MASPTANASDAGKGLLGTRAEAMHRLKVGVGGLLAVLLMVAIASSVLQSAREAEDAATPAEVQAAKDAETNDPLVDIGVSPELPKESAVVVPDLPADQIPPEARGDMPPAPPRAD